MSAPTSLRSRSRSLLQLGLLCLALILTAVWFLSPWYALSVGRNTAEPRQSSPLLYRHEWWVGWTDSRLVQLHITEAPWIAPSQPVPSSEWVVEIFTPRPDSSWTRALLSQRQPLFSWDTEGRSDTFAGTRTTVKIPGLLLVLLVWLAVRRAYMQPDTQSAPESDA